jgi:predicted amidohydrolase YtcJ
MYLKKLLYACVLLACLSSCGNKNNPGTAVPLPGNLTGDIYFGTNILTMEGDSANYVQAVVVHDGKIIFAGTKDSADLFKKQYPQWQEHNLGDLTMLPGFVDGHSHFSEIGFQAAVADLLPAPDGDVNSIAEIIKKLKADTSWVRKDHNIIIGMNYDDGQLGEKRHPTRHDLDSVSTSIPVMIIHQSGHLCVLNSKALEKVNIRDTTKNPAGGVIRREADGVTPNGVLEELAFFNALPDLYPNFSDTEKVNLFKVSIQKYVENGFTTIQDGRTSPINLKSLIRFDSAHLLTVDVVSYPDLITFNEAYRYPKYHLDLTKLVSRTYEANHRFRVGGVKLTLDGSPQGRTAWFSKPYLNIDKTNNIIRYNGYPAFQDEKVLKDHLKAVFKNKWQLLAHCNGDSASAQLLDFLKPYTSGEIDHRTTIIHGQFMTELQIDDAKKQGIFVSAFPLHTFNWGDFHIQSLGIKRAENLSPTGWFRDRGMKFSIHSDAPVIFPKSMPLLSTAVLRKTRTNHLLGEKQCLSPYTALQAMTIWPAYQHFEEKTKGSIQKDKLADFVILDKNPLKTPHEELNAIKVIRTIKEGKIVFDSESMKPVK